MRLHLPGHGIISFVREGAYATIAHHGGTLFFPSKTYKIDGSTWAVVKTAPSKYVPSVTMVTLKEI